MAPQQASQSRVHDRLPVILKGENGSPQPVNDVKCLHVPGAKGVPFWVPEQQVAPGTGLEGPGGKLPKLFTPLKIRGIEMPNRIWVSPMCQYSAFEGFHTPWHVTHYGGIAQRGVSISTDGNTACKLGANLNIAGPDDGRGLCCPGQGSHHS